MATTFDDPDVLFDEPLLTFVGDAFVPSAERTYVVPAESRTFTVAE